MRVYIFFRQRVAATPSDWWRCLLRLQQLGHGHGHGHGHGLLSRGAFSWRGACSLRHPLRRPVSELALISDAFAPGTERRNKNAKRSAWYWIRGKWKIQPQSEHTRCIFGHLKSTNAWNSAIHRWFSHFPEYLTLCGNILHRIYLCIENSLVTFPSSYSNDSSNFPKQFSD